MHLVKADLVAKKFGMLVDSNRARKLSPRLFVGNTLRLNNKKTSMKTLQKSMEKNERVLGRWDKEEHDKFIVGL